MARNGTKLKANLGMAGTGGQRITEVDGVHILMP
jgi:hypothetical protein